MLEVMLNLWNMIAVQRRQIAIDTEELEPGES